MSGGTAATNMTATKLAAERNGAVAPANDAASAADVAAGGDIIPTTVIGTMIIEELVTVTVENTTEEFGTDEADIVPHSPLKMAVVAGCLSLIIILTIGGNILVVLSPAVSKRLRTVTYTFLVSLATADLLLGITVLPWSAIYTINSEWPFSVVFCNIYISCDVMFCTSSILHLLVISLERYFAITRPYAYQRKMSHKKAWIVIVIVWVVSLGVSFLPIHLGWNTADGSVQNYNHPSQCILTWNMAYALFDGILLFFLPLILMLFVYARIVTIAYHQAKAIKRTMVAPAPSIIRGNNSSSPEKQENTNNNHRGVVDEHKAVKIIAVVMGSFVVCWVPYFTMFTFGPLCNWRISDLFYNIVLWLGYINSLINPLVYALMNREFRKAFKTILSCARWNRKCIGSFGSHDSQIKSPLNHTNTRYNGSVTTYATKDTTTESYVSSKSNESKRTSDIYLKLFKTEEDIPEVSEESKEKEEKQQEHPPEDVEMGNHHHREQEQNVPLVYDSDSGNNEHQPGQKPSSEQTYESEDQQLQQQKDLKELSPSENKDLEEIENLEQPELSPSQSLELDDQHLLLEQAHEQEKVSDFEDTDIREDTLQEQDRVSSSDSIPMMDEDQHLLQIVEEEEPPIFENTKLGAPDHHHTLNNDIIVDLP